MIMPKHDKYLWLFILSHENEKFTQRAFFNDHQM